MMPRKQRLTRRSDYDGAWKEALRTHLPDLMRSYFPNIYAVIDWTVQPEWRDKELSQVLGRMGRRNSHVDVLVRVKLLSGDFQWILLHVEVQTTPESGFAQRVSLYNSALFWVFRERVVTLVVLADLSRDWLPQEDLFRVADFESRMRFPTCKLIEKLDSAWSELHSLPVVLARAQIAALRTAGDAEGRYRAKWSLVRNLYGLGYNADEVREIFRLLDWLMQLPEELNVQFRQELNELEETLEMPYITSVERIARAEGKAEGEARILLRLLTRLCGPIPDELEERIRSLPTDGLQSLGDAILDFRSVEQLTRWLAAYNPTNPLPDDSRSS